MWRLWLSRQVGSKVTYIFTFEFTICLRYCCKWVSARVREFMRSISSKSSTWLQYIHIFSSHFLTIHFHRQSSNGFVYRYRISWARISVFGTIICAKKRLSDKFLARILNIQWTKCEGKNGMRCKKSNYKKNKYIHIYKHLKWMMIRVVHILDPSCFTHFSSNLVFMWITFFFRVYTYLAHHNLTVNYYKNGVSSIYSFQFSKQSNSFM